jgi:hypothetical protein
MEGHLEALLEMDFCTKPPNFGVEAHMEAPAGDALRATSVRSSKLRPPNLFCRPNSKIWRLKMKPQLQR